MDQFLTNLSGKYKTKLRAFTKHWLELGQGSAEDLEADFWRKLLEDGDAEDITNDIVAHYTAKLRQEFLAIVKEFRKV